MLKEKSEYYLKRKRERERKKDKITKSTAFCVENKTQFMQRVVKYAVNFLVF